MCLNIMMMSKSGNYKSLPTKASVMCTFRNTRGNQMQTFLMSLAAPSTYPTLMFTYFYFHISLLLFAQFWSWGKLLFHFFLTSQGRFDWKLLFTDLHYRRPSRKCCFQLSHRYFHRYRGKKVCIIHAYIQKYLPSMEQSECCKKTTQEE